MLVMANSGLEPAHAKGLFWSMQQESVDDPLHRSREEQGAKHHQTITQPPPAKTEAPNHQHNGNHHQDAGRTGREIGHHDFTFASQLIRSGTGLNHDH